MKAELKLLLPAGALAGVLAASLLASHPPPLSRRAASPPDPVASPALVEIPAGRVAWRAAGEFRRDGRLVAAPLETVTIPRLRVMRSQVSVGAYRACVAEGACPAAGSAAAKRTDLPVTGVSWQDARAYAAWLSRRTGARWRLPTDAEWIHLAAERAPAQDTVPDEAAGDPAQRWLALYEREAANEAVAEKAAQPAGFWGVNRRGLADLAGNVWEWTDSCFARVGETSGAPAATTRIENCGVRVVEGRHRTYMVDFVRDPRTGGCAVGTPPRHLGFRLVREEESLLATLARRLRGLLGSAA